MAKQSPMGLSRAFYAAFLLRHDNVESSLAAHEQSYQSGKNDPALLLLSKAIILALSGQSDQAESALRILEESKDLYTVLPAAGVIPLLLGDKSRARRMLVEFDQSGAFLPGEPMPREQVINFLLTDASRDELLKAANGPVQLAFIHHIIALKALAEHEWEAAENHFLASVEAGYPFNDYHVPWSAAYLAQMKRDPNWPVHRGLPD